MKDDDPDISALIIGNHFSWWDGFFVYYLNGKYFHRTYHVMMLEEQLQSRKFLCKAGAFSISPGSRDMGQSLSYATNILNKPGNLLLIYPQGEIQSQHQHQMIFKDGWMRIIEKATQPFKTIFVVTLIDYFSQPKPTLYFYLKEFHNGEKFEKDQIESEFNDYFRLCINKQCIQNK